MRHRDAYNTNRPPLTGSDTETEDEGAEEEEENEAAAAAEALPAVLLAHSSACNEAANMRAPAEDDTFDALGGEDSSDAAAAAGVEAVAEDGGGACLPPAGAATGNFNNAVRSLAERMVGCGLSARTDTATSRAVGS